MTELSEVSHFLKELFPRAGPELLRLLQGAMDQAMLLRSDFYGMRDCVEIAAYRDDEVPHAILLLLLVALEEGSLCIEAARPALDRRLCDFVPEVEAIAWAERIVQGLDGAGYPALIGTAVNDHRPIIAHTVGERQFLYFQRYLRAELDFQRALAARLFAGATGSDVAPWPTIVRDVLSEQTFPLDADQLLALGLALLSDLAIVSGGPGTGKTSIVLTLLRCLIRAGVAPERIALAAPTGRAAQRLSDRTRAASPLLAASTLHHLLGYRPQRNTFSRHCENPIDADVVIVDEVSMVGVVMMSQLLQALGPKTKLVLLGDKDQLPSVDAGAVLANLVPDDCVNAFHGDLGRQLASLFPDLTPSSPLPKGTGRIQNHVVLLRTNHRSQQQIREAAGAINVLDTSIVDRLPALTMPGEEAIASWWRELESSGGCWLLEQNVGSASELRGILRQWAEQAYFRSRPNGTSLADLVGAIEIDDSAGDQTRLTELFTLLDRFRLLTLVRDGAWGCNEINGFLAQTLRPRLDADSRGSLFAGAPVLITRNDPARGLFNGDVGITLRRRGGGLVVLFDRQPCVAIAAEALCAHETGFALTVHKSQGSEYVNVMVVLPPTGGRRLLTKELIYTAITRAKSLAVICGTKEVVKLAIGRRIMRESGFGG